MSLKSLQEAAAPYGLSVDSYQGRYKFSHESASYFGMRNDARAGSHKEASAFLDGYIYAIEHLQRKAS